MKRQEKWKRVLAWMLTVAMAAGGSYGMVSAEEEVAVQGTEIAAMEAEETSGITEALAADPEMETSVQAQAEDETVTEVTDPEPETAAAEPETMTELVTEAGTEAAAELVPDAGTEVEPASETSEAETEAAETEPVSEVGAEQAEEELILEPDYADVEWAEEDFPAVPVAVADDTVIVTVIDENSFPDAVFRKYVSENIDTNEDGQLSQDEADAVVEINVSGYDKEHGVFKDEVIGDLTGIAYFQNLVKLYCNNNELTSLDVSKNPALTDLDCYTNGLSSLDVSKNPALTNLDCSWNGLMSLDMSKNPTLMNLDCSDNELTSLDISKNPALTDLDCAYNALTSLDVSKNPALMTLECRANELMSLDVSKNPALTYLNCWGNELTSLDVSKNPALTDLDCESNQLTSLDVSKNPALTELNCGGNKLTSLDVSKNTALTDLFCANNALVSLDLSMLDGSIINTISVSDQDREVQLKDTGKNLVLDMAEIVGTSNLKQIIGVTKAIVHSDAEGEDYTKGELLEMNPDGTVIFPKDQYPKEVIYVYDTKTPNDINTTVDVKMEVILHLVKGAEHVHSYKAVIKEPTCTENGIIYEECIGCQQKKEGSEKTIPAPGHTGGKATCEKGAVCITCGKEYAAAAGHTGGKATCEKGAVCTVCGKEYTAAAGHTYGAWTKISEATVFKKAVQTRTCSVCGKQESQETGALVPATIKLNASSLKMKAKQKTTKLTVTMSAGDSIASVESSNTKVLKASAAKNKITLTAQKKTGTVNLIVKLASGKSKTIKVTVQKKSVATTKIKGVSKKLTLKKKQKATLKPSLEPITSQDKIKYTSSNKKVATVSSKGVITAKGKGKATITVKAGKKTVKCTVTVK